MTSTPRKISPTYFTANNNIRHYQAIAAAQVYSTAKSVLPNLTNYFLPDQQQQDPLDQEPNSPAASIPEENPSGDPRDKFATFDTLRGRNVLISVTDNKFAIYNVCDKGVDLEELCGFILDNEIVSINIIPAYDSETAPKAAVILKSDENDFSLSIYSLATPTIMSPESTISIPATVLPTSLLTTPHFIALSTTPNNTLYIYSSKLTLLHTIPLPSPVYTASGRWLIYPTTRLNPSFPHSPILDTPPTTALMERLARGITKEVVSWGKETSEKAVEALTAYFSQSPSPTPPAKLTGRFQTTLVIFDVLLKRVLTQIVVPCKVGMTSLSPSGTVLFCSPPRGDEFYVYDLSRIGEAVHLFATYSRGYTYSRVERVLWRADGGCFAVISARGTGHVFSLRRKGSGNKEPGRAIGKVKNEGGVKDICFLTRQAERRRRSSTSVGGGDGIVDILCLANGNQRIVTSWKLPPAQKSAISLLTSYINPDISSEEAQSIPLARAVAQYTLPSTHQEIPFPTLTSSPILKAAFTNQKESTDCTAKAEVECSLSTPGLTSHRGLRLFEYTLTTDSPGIDFGSTLPFTTREINLGIPHGEVRYLGDNGNRSTVETPPSSENDSPELQPETGKKTHRQKKKNIPTTSTSDGGIERAISATLGTELDKTRMVTVPPTPPGSFSTPKVQPAEWVGDILDRGKTIVRNVRRKSMNQHSNAEVCFEEDVEVLSLNDAPAVEELKGSRESVESDQSGKVKVRDDEGVMSQWDT